MRGSIVRIKPDGPVCWGHGLPGLGRTMVSEHGREMMAPLWGMWTTCAAGNGQAQHCRARRHAQGPDFGVGGMTSIRASARSSRSWVNRSCVGVLVKFIAYPGVVR